MQNDLHNEYSCGKFDISWQHGFRGLQATESLITIHPLAIYTAYPCRVAGVSHYIHSLILHMIYHTYYGTYYTYLH